MGSSTFDAVVSVFVTVHPHETSALLHSFFCFFFILSAYFVVLPLRDESAISLGLSNLPGLFVGSLVLTLIAVPFSSLVFSLPNLSKAKKVNVIATTITSSLGRRKLFAQINSFIAVFILVGQLSLTGRILTVAGVTTAICSAPLVGLLNLVALVVWPNWVVVAISETLRKVVTYVVTRPGRELLFTVVSEDEKYKAKVCIDVLVQRLGDASAAGMYKMLFGALNGNASTVSLYGLPICLLWLITAFSLGHRQVQVSKHQISST